MTERWPPPYELRVSVRAKRLSLQICAQRGLVITRPKGCSEAEAIEFLESKRLWIEKHNAIISKAAELQSRPNVLPTLITLHALSKTFPIRYELIPSYRRVKLLELPQELVLCYPNDDYQRCIDALSNWLRIQGERYLTRWLHDVSERCQLSFDQLIIRNQKRRWGSCSSDGQISLNVKLLFMPAPLVEYVMIHELCHTIHMNHSRRFWALVKRWSPHYQEHCCELRHADRYVPDWLAD